MSRLVEALGFEPCEFTLPSVAYVQWRLQITDVSDQVRRAVALLELGRDGRQMLYASKSGRPRSFGDVVRMFVGLPGPSSTSSARGAAGRRSLA